MNRGSDAPEFRLDHVMRVASMRPRFMNRGSVTGTTPPPPLVSGFNEAPIHESGKFRFDSQLRPPESSASMRPRFMNRGSFAAVSRSASTSRASMRPRFMNRGSQAARLANAAVAVRFNEAPIHESGKSR